MRPSSHAGRRGRSTTPDGDRSDAGAVSDDPTGGETPPRSVDVGHVGATTGHGGAGFRTVPSSTSLRRSRERRSTSSFHDGSSTPVLDESGASDTGRRLTVRDAAELARLLEAIRRYTPGSLCRAASEFQSVRGPPSRDRARICFVGEFGAGKTSLINTILHVMRDAHADDFRAFFNTAEAFGSCTPAPMTCVLRRPDNAVTRVAVFDTPGFENFGDRDAGLMKECVPQLPQGGWALTLCRGRYRKYGVREGADVLNKLAGPDAGRVGRPPRRIDAFVWVFALHQSSKRRLESESAGTVTIPARSRVTRRRTAGNRRGYGAVAFGGGGDEEDEDDSATDEEPALPLPRRRARRSKFAARSASARPASGTAPEQDMSALRNMTQTGVYVTKQGLELNKKGLKLFRSFFRQCIIHGVRPVVVVTHIDGFDKEQLDIARAAVERLTEVGKADIIMLKCYTPESHRYDLGTELAAARIVERALRNGDRAYVPESYVAALDRHLFGLYLSLVQLWRQFKQATFLRAFVVFLVLVVVLVVLFTWQAGVRHCKRGICALLDMAGRPCPFVT